MYKIWKSCSRPTRKLEQKLDAKQYLLHMRHLRTTNIGCGFMRYSYAVKRIYGTISVYQSVGRLVCHGCIVVKQCCEIGPRLVLTTNRKSHIGFQVT